MTTTITSHALEAIDARKVYPGGVVGLDGVSLQVKPGETVALVGESGSGKTTLLKLFNRLLEADSGSVLVWGREVSKLDAVCLRRATGYVLQEGGLLPHWTVGRNVEMVPQLLDRDADVIGLLSLVGLDASLAHRYPRELSGGQRQRVAIARALAAEPKVLLMDEPFGALDPITRHDVCEEFARLREQMTISVLLVTHDLEEAFDLGHRVAVMKDGRIHQLAPPEELVAAPASDYVRALLARRRGS